MHIAPKIRQVMLILQCIATNTRMYVLIMMLLTSLCQVDFRGQGAGLVVSHVSEWYTSVFDSNPTVFLRWQPLSKTNCRNAKCSKCFFPVPALSFYLLIIDKWIKNLQTSLCETHWNHFYISQKRHTHTLFRLKCNMYLEKINWYCQQSIKICCCSI